MKKITKNGIYSYIKGEFNNVFYCDVHSLAPSICYLLNFFPDKYNKLYEKRLKLIENNKNGENNECIDNLKQVLNIKTSTLGKNKIESSIIRTDIIEKSIIMIMEEIIRLFDSYNVVNIVNDGFFYKMKENETFEECKEKVNLKLKSINEILKCDFNFYEKMFVFDYCNYILVKNNKYYFHVNNLLENIKNKYKKIQFEEIDDKKIEDAIKIILNKGELKSIMNKKIDYELIENVRDEMYKLGFFDLNDYLKYLNQNAPYILIEDYCIADDNKTSGGAMKFISSFLEYYNIKLPFLIKFPQMMLNLNDFPDIKKYENGFSFETPYKIKFKGRIILDELEKEKKINELDRKDDFFVFLLKQKENDSKIKINDLINELDKMKFMINFGLNEDNPKDFNKIVVNQMRCLDLAKLLADYATNTTISKKEKDNRYNQLKNSLYSFNKLHPSNGFSECKACLSLNRDFLIKNKEVYLKKDFKWKNINNLSEEEIKQWYLNIYHNSDKKESLNKKWQEEKIFFFNAISSLIEYNDNFHYLNDESTIKDINNVEYIYNDETKKIEIVDYSDTILEEQCLNVNMSKINDISEDWSKKVDALYEHICSNNKIKEETLRNYIASQLFYEDKHKSISNMALFLIGTSGTGKSTLMNLVKKIFGEKLYHADSNGILNKNEYQLLIDKRFAIWDDSSYFNKNDVKLNKEISSLFTTLVNNNEVIIKRLYLNPYKRKLSTSPIVVSNYMPSIDKIGLKTRSIIIDVNNKMVNNKEFLEKVSYEDINSEEFLLAFLKDMIIRKTKMEKFINENKNILRQHFQEKFYPYLILNSSDTISDYSLKMMINNLPNGLDDLIGMKMQVIYNIYSNKYNGKLKMNQLKKELKYFGYEIKQTFVKIDENTSLRPSVLIKKNDLHKSKMQIKKIYLELKNRGYDFSQPKIQDRYGIDLFI